MSTSDDRSVIAWDADSLRPVEVFAGAPGRQMQAGYSRDGKTLFSAGQDGGVYLWDLTRTRRWQIQLDPAGPYIGANLDPANAMAVFDIPRNRALVAEGQNAYMVDLGDRQARRHPIDLGSPLHQWPELSARRGTHGDGARQRPGAGVGRRDPPAAAGRAGGRPGREPDLELRATPASPATAGRQRSPRTTTRRPTGPRSRSTTSRPGSSCPTPGGSRGGGNRIGASPDGTLLVATTSAGYGAVWEPARAPEIARLQLPEDGSATLARFSRDGRYLAIGNGVGRPALWQVDGWRFLWQAEVGHNGYDVALSFSPDGSVLASSGTDSKIFMYDLATGGLLGGAFGPDRNSWLYAEYRSDRNELVGYFDDGSLVRWDVDPKSQVRTACKIAGRDMTQREWDRLLPGRPFQTVCPGAGPYREPPDTLTRFDGPGWRASSDECRAAQIRASAARSGSRPRRTEVERGPVERLQVEVGALALLRVGPGLQPDALPDLVRRRLSRPAQVAVELEPEDLVGRRDVGAHELPAQLGRPPLTGVERDRTAAVAEPVVGRDLQLQVHADVDDHAGRPQSPARRACRACRPGRRGSPARP